MTEKEKRLIVLMESDVIVLVIETFEFEICFAFRASDFEFSLRA